MTRVLFFLMFGLVTSLAQAAALPAYSGRVNSAVGSIVQSKVGKLGFAANDPRFGATVGAIGTAATTVAVGVATGAVATVGWPALLVGAGIGAVISGAVGLGLDELIQWAWPDSDHPDKTRLSGEGMGGSSVEGVAKLPLLSGGYPDALDLLGSPAEGWFANDKSYTRARHFRSVRVFCPTVGSPHCAGSSASTSPMDSAFVGPHTSGVAGPNGLWSNQYRRKVSTSGNPAGGEWEILYEFLPPSGVILYPPAYSPTWQSPAKSVEDLPESYLTQPLSDAQLAAIANALWRSSLSSGDPQAIPWPASDPISTADISSWRSANPELVPTVQDFISPVASPGASTVTIPHPGGDSPSQPDPDPEAPPSTGDVKIEWGSFVPPSLENTPTAESILSPLFSLWPQWSDFAFPAHASDCPQPQFVAMGHTFTFSSLCEWSERVRPMLQAAFGVAWALMIVFIVMGA